ncbi:unnamed protein product, partial [Prorocentrum cordatum]
ATKQKIAEGLAAKSRKGAKKRRRTTGKQEDDALADLEDKIAPFYMTKPKGEMMADEVISIVTMGFKGASRSEIDMTVASNARLWLLIFMMEEVVKVPSYTPKMQEKHGPAVTLSSYPAVRKFVQKYITYYTSSSDSNPANGQGPDDDAEANAQEEGSNAADPDACAIAPMAQASGLDKAVIEPIFRRMQDATRRAALVKDIEAFLKNNPLDVSAATVMSRRHVALSKVISAIWAPFTASSPSADQTPDMVSKMKDSGEWGVAVTHVVELVGKSLWEAIDPQMVAAAKELDAIFAGSSAEKSVLGHSLKFDALAQAWGCGKAGHDAIGQNLKRFLRARSKYVVAAFAELANIKAHLLEENMIEIDDGAGGSHLRVAFDSFGVAAKFAKEFDDAITSMDAKYSELGHWCAAWAGVVSTSWRLDRNVFVPRTDAAWEKARTVAKNRFMSHNKTELVRLMQERGEEFRDSKKEIIADELATREIAAMKETGAKQQEWDVFQTEYKSSVGATSQPADYDGGGVGSVDAVLEAAEAVKWDPQAKFIRLFNSDYNRVPTPLTSAEFKAASYAAQCTTFLMHTHADDKGLDHLLVKTPKSMKEFRKFRPKVYVDVYAVQAAMKTDPDLVVFTLTGEVTAGGAAPPTNKDVYCAGKLPSGEFLYATPLGMSAAPNSMACMPGWIVKGVTSDWTMA